MVIEPQEEKQYAEVIPKEKILVLPFSNLGQGSIPARNWVWEHSIAAGATRHWILDDNLKSFLRLNQNLKIQTSNGGSFAAIEDFSDRYQNVAMSGMNYAMFTERKNGKYIRPITINTRIYSCILLSNLIPHRWRGRYNEDTDLSLRILKSGLCTVLFNGLVADKASTMSMSGGNTEELYKLGNQDGRLLMAQSLQQQHPDITTIKWKWGRWQHSVTYGPFKNNKLLLKPGAEIPTEPNEYGMKLRKKADA